MAGKDNKPAIRFAGFSEDWDQRKLGEDVADIVGGGTPSTINPAYWGGDIDWYSPTEIGEKVYANGSEKKITELGLQKSSAKLLPAGKTVLFTSRAGIGDMAILQRAGTTNQGFQSLVLKEGYDTYFIYSMGNLIKLYAEQHSSGSTFLEISGKTLGKMELNAPSTEEQTQIGSFFKSVDNLITLQQRKVDKLVIAKKSMLEKMFPQDGANVPEIRFAGFSEDWQRRKLGEAFNQTVEYVNPQTQNIELWSLTVENGLTPKTERYVRDFLVRKEDKYKVVHPNDVVYNPMNMTLGAIGYNSMQKTVAVSGYYITMKPTEIIDGYYIKTWMQRTHAIKLYKMCATGSLLEKQRVQYPAFADINFTVPKIEEQKKIGAYFRSLESLITLHHHKLQKLKNIKQALLEKMFV